MDAISKSILIVLQNCLEKDDIDNISTILKNYEAISKGQRKEVCEKIKKENYNAACEKIVNSLQKNDWKGFEQAVDDEDFPCDAESRKVLLFLRRSDANNKLNFLLLRWEIVEGNLSDLENILGIEEAERKKETRQRVKSIINVMMNMIRRGNEAEQEMVDAANDFIAKKENSAQSLSAGDPGEIQEKTTIKLKRPAVASDKPPPPESTASSDVNMPKGDTKRLSTENSGQESGAKKQRVENKKPEIDQTLCKHDINDGEKEQTEPEHDSSNENLSKAHNDGSEIAKSQDVSEQSKDGNAAKANEVIVISDGSDDDAGSSSQCDVEHKNREDSTDTDYSGPMTRSKAAEKSVSDEDKKEESTNATDSFVTFLSSDEPVCYLERSKRALEFRAVMQQSRNMPNNVSLCLACPQSDWKPVEMAYNERKRYFFLRLEVADECKDYLEFKFSYSDSNTGKTIWEKLPGPANVNRRILPSQLKTPWTFILNVCLFTNVNDWRASCCNCMEQFLPSLECLHEAPVSETSFSTDIFCWLNCVIHGWETNAKDSWFQRPKPADFEKLLMDWLEKLYSSSSGSFIEVRDGIQTALIIAVLIAHEKHHIRCSALFRILFKMMRVDKLNRDDCQLLCDSVMNEFSTASEHRVDFPTYRVALEWLYKHLPKCPNLDWLFSLPLYWLMVHREVKEEVLKPNPEKLLLYSRSSLPSIPGFDWTKVQQNCYGSDQSCQLIQLAPEVMKVAKLHPWIISTYQYLLSYKALGKLILSREETRISNLFFIDSVLRQYLLGYVKKQYSDYTESDNQYCSEYFEQRLCEAISSASEPDITLDVRKQQLEVCTSIVTILNLYLGSNWKILSNDETFWCLNVIAQKTIYWANLLDIDEKNLEYLNEQLRKMLEIFQKRIYYKAVDKGEVEHWNKLLRIEWSMGCLARKWKEQIVYEIKCAIKNNWLHETTREMDGEKYLQFYVDQLSETELQTDVEKCFDEIAFESTEKMLQNTKEPTIFGSIKSWIGGKLGRPSRNKFVGILEKLFNKAYKRFSNKVSSDTTTTLNFLCNWSFSAHFYELFGQELPQTFSAETKSIIKMVKTNLNKVVASLQAADILIEHLEIILDKRERFLQVLTALNPKKNEARSNVPDCQIANAVDFCEVCLKVFKKTRGAMENFIQVCNYIEYDDLAEMPHKRLVDKVEADLQNKRIMDLVTFQASDDKPVSHSFFEITEEQFQEVQEISFIKDSKKMFQEMFVAAVEKRKATGIPLFGDILNAWADVKTMLFILAEEIDVGTIIMNVVLQRFAILNGVENDIECEVDLFYDFYSTFKQPDDEEVLMLENRELRKKQILNVFQLQQANESVDVLLELKELLMLKGDFKAIAARRKMVENRETTELRSIPKTLEIPEICDLNRRKLEVLKTFCTAQELINWLQNELKDMAGVKLMSDFAMIAAGEDPIQVDSVSCMLSASMGFAPLLFWTDKAKMNEGSKELLGRCEKVCKNADRDEKLLEKWNQTSHQLQWFIDVNKFHGSVEKLSLTRVQEINDRGIYTIARRNYSQPLTINNCVHLRITKDSNTDSEQYMTVEELRELQSKLMLIAGEADKGQRDVKLFMETLTSVEKLSEAFMQLVVSGCMLFAGWEAIIICDGSSNSNTIGNLRMQVKFTDDSPAINGSGSCRELDKLTDIFQKLLHKWIEHIFSKRIEFYHLNEFSIQQIMYLCHELSHFDVGIEEIPDQVRTLLSFVRKNFTTEELQICLKNSRKRKLSHDDMDIEFQEQVQPYEEPVQEELKVNEDADDSRNKIEAVRILVSEDFEISENVAKAGVQAEGYSDLDACRNWTLLHQFDEDLVEELAAEFDVECASTMFGPCDEELKVDHSVFNTTLENTLNDVITNLHENIDGNDFLHSIATVCSGYVDETVVLDLQDHLSIQHFGQFLDNFSDKSPISRCLLPELHPGRPNLLVCGNEEILPSVLSLYMHDYDQPLPSRSEVLICSEGTTSDEVERFLRRAMCKCVNKGQPLYALAFSDKLNYSTSSAVEDTFNDLLKSKKLDENYQLVFLLSKRQHYIATCFDKYLVDGKWKQPTKKIKSYLKRKLQVEEPDESAASVTEGNYLVKVITSARSGVGKSLHIQRLKEKLMETEIESRCATIRMLENKLSTEDVIKKLQLLTGESQKSCFGSHRLDSRKAVLAHIDLSPAVRHGIETFAFNLFVLGSIQGRDGRIWKTSANHFYAVETTDFEFSGQKRFSHRHILNLLPSVTCYAPDRILHGMFNVNKECLGMDQEEFLSETFQRPFQYLSRYENNDDLDEFVYAQPEGTKEECIAVLLRHCCIENPSWAQIRYFCSFLNVQLKSCEKSVFCSSSYFKKELNGLKIFAVKFMIRMAQDFATPSLKIADKSMKDAPSTTTSGHRRFVRHQIRRRWEESSHPYVFFNEDGQTMTFINVKIDSEGYLLNQDGQREEKIATAPLVDALQRQGFHLDRDFDSYPRREQLRFLRQVLGVMEHFDPDPTYELTTDNALKILAIYMRFKCQIPVIIMGETGCGKTRLVEFMTKLKAGPCAQENDALQEEVNATEGKDKPANMITLKIHGGITVENIYESIEEAKRTELKNRGSQDFTVLFYDEANTTEAIYAIKEVLCDGSIDGKSFGDSKLRVIAACNPYKKLSDEAIKKLEDSGLGYRIRTSETAHLFGNIPVRSLVYRVVALPPSMQPFIWDFGQLSNETERLYIQQMTRKLAKKLGLNSEAINLIINVLSSCQKYMRNRRDECRYVSLRDVERCMVVYKWFHEQHEIINEIRELNGETRDHVIAKEVSTLIQTVGVCYHASLHDRESFRDWLATCIDVDAASIKTELESCQAAFLSTIEVGENIAINKALRENVFMMAICADMRIPLFLIGKPGSSKSLAKTIITRNMQGQASDVYLYQHLKQVHILSYQCSALTDAKGIKRIFNQCIQLQKKQNPDTYTAVVVLDEIGLAEDSANMPLKALHALLEHRPTDRLYAERVGFVGISNWALDPAKMNRGIFLTRNIPTKDDLKKTGKGLILPKSLWQRNAHLFEKLTTTYIETCETQEVEYFGLRDYYSLMKMICKLCNLPGEAKERVAFDDVVYSVLRNFGGGNFNYSVTERFVAEAHKLPQFRNCTRVPIIPVQRMIKDNLSETDSRFLLLLANQFSIVSLLESSIEGFTEGAQVVFGSSFPGDHSYTEICRNINRIKVCMETGKTVILLNMTNIHESLYDALNQHYVTFLGQNYVDLGLGGHRVKCRIAKKFRLIVIERKDVVFREYPIPLINRLEKHHFNSESLLNERQKSFLEKMMTWVKDFSSVHSLFSYHHAFIGFHDDTVSSVVLMASNDETEKCKEIFLQTCTMDAILRLPGSRLREDEVEYLQNIYFNDQQHDRLTDVIKKSMTEKDDSISVLEITSFSGILSKREVSQIESDLSLPERSILLLTLEQFQTRDEYSGCLSQFFELCKKHGVANGPMVLLIQCAQAQSHASLIACARHCLMHEVRHMKKMISETGSTVNVIVALLMSTEREGMSGNNVDSFNLQHTQETRIVHVDELHSSDGYIGPVSKFFGKSLCQVFKRAEEGLENEGRLESLVNIRFLLIDCICEAIAKVKTQYCDDHRYLERVKILMHLCKDDGIAGRNFRKILLKKATDVYSKRENEEMERNWVVERANNRERLQEGGTFGKTLWLCLKDHVSRLLGLVISKIDRYDNLDRIVQGEKIPWELNMWLGMFDQVEIETRELASSEFVIGRAKYQYSCKLPFSFLIIDFLETQWKAFEMQRTPNIQDSLNRLFRDCRMKKVVEEALNSTKMGVMKGLVADTIGYMYKPGTTDEAEVSLVENSFFNFCMKNFAKARQENDFQTGDEVVVIFMTYKTIMKKLEIFSEVLQSCPQVLKNSVLWTVKQDNSSDFILHVLAFKDVLILLKEMAENMQEPMVCIEWINLARHAKQMYGSVASVAADGSTLKTIEEDWTSCLLLDLLLLQLLPPPHSNDLLFQRFVKVIAPHAKRFWKSSAKADPRSYDFMRIVLNVLKLCLSNVELQLLIDWQDSTCRSCRKKVQNPVSLTCGHFSCKKCIDFILIASDKRRPVCPACNAVILESFMPHPAILVDKDAKILNIAKSSCTSFFLGYLEKFCFKKAQMNSSRMEKHIKRILEELVVQSDENSRKELDSTSLNLNVSTKSSIFQILLSHSHDLVIEEINDWLQKLQSGANIDLITVLLNNMEQNVLVNSSKFDGKKEKLTAFWENLLGHSWRKLLIDEDSLLDMKMLQRLAEVRCALGYFTSLVEEDFRKVEYHGDTRVRIEGFVKLCVSLLASDAMPRAVKEFVIKTGCRKFGKLWLLRLAQRKDLWILIPPSLRQAAEEPDVHLWVQLGQEYIDARAELYHSPPDQNRQVTDVILSRSRGNSVPHMLAIASWCDKKQQVVKDEVEAILNQHCGNRNNLVVKFLNQNQQRIKSILESNVETTQQVQVLYQLLILIIAATESQNDIMKDFRRIIMTPQDARNLFLPAMPEDMYFVTPASYRVENQERNSMYKCPNGHLYSIGDCTRPYVTAKCPSCRSTIGGASHKPAAGNERVVQQARNQAGYKLSGFVTGAASTGADRMSPQGDAVVQLLLHSSFLAATVEHRTVVSSILSSDEPERFLVTKLIKNLHDLSGALARNEDDTLLALLKLLVRIINQGGRQHTENWSTVDARKEWEQTFRINYLLPVFQNLDQEIVEARAAVRCAEEAGNKPLSMLIDEVIEEDLAQEISWEHPLLWTIVEHPTSAHLLQVLEDGLNEGKVLQIIIQTPDLHFIKYLENILALQSMLIERYQYEIDMNDAEQMSFRCHIAEGGHQEEAAIKEYIKAWNRVSPKLHSTVPTNIRSYFEELSLDSPISMALPSTRGRGQCAKSLAEYLIDIQNQFLANSMMVIRPTPGLLEGEVKELIHTDFVCIDKRRDLLGLINMHTNYSIETDENGRHHHISYNIEALEKQVREKFVMRKKQIKKNTLLLIKYPQDVGIGSDWQSVSLNINQEPLTEKLSQDIDRVVGRSHSSEVCEGVRTLTNAISFLAMIKTDRMKSLVEFLEKDLKLPSARISLIPRSTQICHVLSVYQRLCWHKAVIFIQQGLDPYKVALAAIGTDEIAGELLENTKEALRHTDVVMLQQKMNEILITAAGIDHADWSLAEDVFPNVQFIDKNDDASWYSKLPEGLLVKHISHLFALTVKFDKNRNAP